MLAKADRKDGKGEVEGYYLYDEKMKIPLIYDGFPTEDRCNPPEHFYEYNEIISSTLKYSFNGDEWYSEDEIKKILKRYDDFHTNF